MEGSTFSTVENVLFVPRKKRMSIIKSFSHSYVQLFQKIDWGPRSIKRLVSDSLKKSYFYQKHEIVKNTFLGEQNRSTVLVIICVYISINISSVVEF